ncbi:MAG: hypothetical protein MRY74_00025 [Neomegalonema sp.]|nr:hypothetical protein [Neomegalonema sp.]
MIPFRDARRGAAACAPIATPPGVLLQATQSPGRAALLAACLALDAECAAAFLAQLEAEQRRAQGWAWARWKQLPRAMRDRLGALRQPPLLTSAGCFACRDAAPKIGGKRLCVTAGAGGIAADAAVLGARRRLLLRVTREFAPSAGMGGLRLVLAGLAPVEQASA